MTTTPDGDQMTDAKRLAEIKAALEEAGLHDWEFRGTVAIIRDLCQQVRQVHADRKRLEDLERGVSAIRAAFEKSATARIKGDKKTAKAMIAEAYKAAEALRVWRGQNDFT